jgi:hypothetical protein
LLVILGPSGHPTVTSVEKNNAESGCGRVVPAAALVGCAGRLAHRIHMSSTKLVLLIVMALLSVLLLQLLAFWLFG